MVIYGLDEMHFLRVFPIVRLWKKSMGMMNCGLTHTTKKIGNPVTFDFECW